MAAVGSSSGRASRRRAPRAGWRWYAVRPDPVAGALAQQGRLDLEQADVAQRRRLAEQAQARPLEAEGGAEEDGHHGAAEGVRVAVGVVLLQPVEELAHRPPLEQPVLEALGEGADGAGGAARPLAGLLHHAGELAHRVAEARARLGGIAGGDAGERRASRPAAARPW